MADPIPKPDPEHAVAEVSEPAPRLPRFTTPSERIERERRSQRLLLLTIRLLFLVLLVTISLLPFVGTVTETQDDWGIGHFIGLALTTFAFGVVILIVDASLPNKRLATVFGVYLGIVAGLLGGLAIGAVLDLVAGSWGLTTPTNQAYIGLFKVAIGITLCYLAVSIVLTTKDDFRLVIPYVEFARQVRGVRPFLLDTSVLIDGRIDQLAQTGFLAAPLIVPQFVVDELQKLADSGDKLKRARGRRGLEMVSHLQANPSVDVSVDNTVLPGHSVDHMLLQLAGDQNLRVISTDYNLNKVARIHDVTVLNLHDLASAMKSQAIPGETLSVEVVKTGEGPRQGVGYMPDGTMVVIEEAADRIGQTVALTVTNSLQTSAGRMIFGRPAEGEAEPAASSSEQMARAATHQPRTTERPRQVDHSKSPRNPRR
ncbi:MAG: hypothetical protein JSV91_07715 [Phycisphaerales bacterium]|nr:MAG: hypothetical protein JSV91_07715 [Phycisphaerales bacterium]